jgi:hypothetical protein
MGNSASTGCPLRVIIAKADAIDHAILTEPEFTRAVGRLVAADLIGADPRADRYRLTETGHDLYQRQMKRRDLFGWTETLLPPLRTLGEPHHTAWTLRPGTFDCAVLQYLDAANRVTGLGHSEF